MPLEVRFTHKVTDDQKGPSCRGCPQLGTACGVCWRCREVPSPRLKGGRTKPDPKTTHERTP